MTKFPGLLELIKSKELTDVEWLADKAGPSSVLFYRLPNQSESAYELMLERLKTSSYGLAVVNGVEIKGKGTRDAIFLDEQDFYEARARVAELFYPLPKKKYIAITGTNGKTTTVDLIRQILVGSGIAAASVGTLGFYINQEKKEDFGLTTPDFIDLRKTLHRYQDAFEVCALEASSIALEQRRLDGVTFDAIGWTSFSQDHLDFHGSMEEYFRAKLELLTMSKTPFFISARASLLVEMLGKKAMPADESPALNNEFFRSAFNRINLDVALACLREIGIKPKPSHLEKLVAPPGRYNVLKRDKQLFVIDYSHTPDALENICSELKSAYPEKTLVCVFGCGGDRDRSKRPLMGSAASKHCDHVIITSDNPRFESPESIVNDILPGMGRSSYEVELDRSDAIKQAVRKFRDAVILIAGKGHEDYLEVKGEKLPYSDKSELERILKNDNI